MISLKMMINYSSKTLFAICKALLNGCIPEVKRTTFKTSIISSRLIFSSFLALETCFKNEELSGLVAEIAIAINF